MKGIYAISLLVVSNIFMTFLLVRAFEATGNKNNQ